MDAPVNAVEQGGDKNIESEDKCSRYYDTL